MRFTGASSLRRAARWHCRSSRTGPIKPRCSAANHNGVRVDLRVMDRGSRSHQIGSHQTADGARQFWRIVMLQRERPQGVRLGIEVEADATRSHLNAPKRRLHRHAGGHQPNKAAMNARGSRTPNTTARPRIRFSEVTRWPTNFLRALINERMAYAKRHHMHRLEEPVRTKCASPRASLRSVLWVACDLSAW
jgi:hypothetical protein